MWGLLLPTIVAGAADSLNPMAITQQFALQGMVKKPKHIWYFIIPTGLTNLAGGFLAYFGLAAFVGNFVDELVQAHGQALFTAELILGIACLVSVGFLLQRGRIQALEKQMQSLRPGEREGGGDEEAAAARNIKSVSPMALTAMGVGATLGELATALPYFAFLAILLRCQLTLAQVTFLLIVYNTIYTLPLMILYFIYRRAQHRFDRLYRGIRAGAAKWAGIAAPALMSLAGVVLVYHSISVLL